MALSQWPGTLAEDETLLRAPEALSDDMRLAITFRAGKKRVLADAVTGLKERMQAHFKKVFNIVIDNNN